MKPVVTVLAIAALFVCVWAAGNAVVGARPTAKHQSPIAGRQSLDAITIPQMLSYQGKLPDTMGVPVPDGNYALTFRLYAQPTGGSAVWTEAQTIPVKNGLFAALLGAVTPITSLPESGACYLSLQVALSPELSPRQRIVSAAYSYLAARSANSDLLQGKDTTGFVRTGQANSVTSDMIVDGTIAAVDLNQMGATDGQVLEWRNSAWAPTTPVPAPHTHIGESWSSTSADLGLGVKLDRNSSNAVYGKVDTVLNSGSGSANGASIYVGGTGTGDKLGVDCFIGGTGTGDRVGANCHAYNAYGGNATGGSFDGDVLTGSGEAVGLEGTGWAGGSSSGEVVGIRGNAQNFSTGTGYTQGGQFSASAAQGATRVDGVYVQASANSGPAYGLYSQAQSASGPVYAVYALRVGGGDYAGYFDGNVTVTGNLSKGGGSFQIDHPLDPLNKYLFHSFVESPDMMNIYNGNLVSDARGYATVSLPNWFQALNRDFRYQLTVIDERDSDGFAQAKVVRGVKDNSFVIRTSVPFTTVSWQVTGIRQDPYANANRIQVEVDKPAGERGKYIHPEAYGLPAEAGIGYRPAPDDPKARAARHDR